MKERKGPRKPQWDRSSIRALREHLEMTQQELAGELGTRQQTISEWETGLYRPRGASARLLSLVAERARFPYEARAAVESGSSEGAEPPSPRQSKAASEKGKTP